MTTAVKPPASTRRALSALRGTTQTLADSVLATRERVAAIHENADLSLEAQQRQLAEARDQLRGTVDQVETTAVESLLAVETAAEATDDGADPAAALLHENRLHRCWARLRDQLENGGTEPSQLARTAAEAGDRLVFEALREELSAWMAARRNDADYIEATLMEIDLIEAPLRTPAEGAARDALATAVRLRNLCATNCSTVRLDLETTFLLLGENEEGDTATVELPMGNESVSWPGAGAATGGS